MIKLKSKRDKKGKTDFQQYLECRIVREAHYIIHNRATVREAAKHFETPKTTIHRDVYNRLQGINQELYEQVRDILDYHLDVRAARGGQADKPKKRRRIG